MFRSKNGWRKRKLTTLDDVERTLSSEDIVISDGKKAIGLAGDNGWCWNWNYRKYKNIMIESAIFDNVKIRKTSKEILRSEASNRFEKGLDPNRTYMANRKILSFVRKICRCQNSWWTCKIWWYIIRRY